MSQEPSPIVNKARQDMKKAVDHTLHEFATLHTGKASPSMVESVSVEAYGSAMRLKDIAAITTPDSRLIVIQPWDKGVLQDVKRGIEKANLGFNPVVEGNVLRIPIPDLSRERRQELVKVAHTMAEQGRVSVRNVRRDAMDALKKAKSAHLSEDEIKRLEKEVQTETDKSIADINKHLEHKEKELLQV